MAKNIIALYQKMYDQSVSLQKREKIINEQLSLLANKAKTDGNALQPTYQKEVAAIDEEINRLEIYVSSARTHSPLTNYTPVAEKVHPVALQQLYTMLSNSPEGRRVAIELQKKCANAKKYFENEKNKLTNELQNKTRALNSGATDGPEAKRLKNELSQIYRQYENLASGTQAQELVTEIAARSDAFFIKPAASYRIAVPLKNRELFCVGFIYFPFSLGERYSSQVAKTFGRFYNPTDKTVIVPLCIPADGMRPDGLYRTTNISIAYDDTTRDKTYQIFQGFLFNVLRAYKPLQHRVTYIDMDTYNPEQLGYMRKFVGENGLISFPNNIDSAKAALNTLNSVASAEEENKRERRYLIIRGIKSSGHGDLSETVRKICNNFRKNNVVTIFLDRQDDKHSSVSWLTQLHIGLTVSSKNGMFITEQGGNQLRFGFFASPGGLEPTSEVALLGNFQPKKYDNRYEAFFPLNKLPAYLTQKRQREKIVVPYGMDEKTGQVSYFRFEEMNFAAFLMGGAGSGKTTLIHAIIAGIINTYHPDEVELWLADFKEAGFAPYENNMPPHIKYILMDSSPEMVCAFIDKLHEELMRRKSILKSTPDRLDVPVSRYMPAIFVVIDEFAAISETIKSRPKHQLRLTTLMTQGRSLGFRFVFSSQAFTTGAGALDPTAKGQIQARIAMAHSKVDEIKGVLELPTITDEAKEMINNLRAHYVLYKNPLPNGYKLNRSLGLYFPGSGMDAWPSRYALFERLNKNMRPVDEKDYDCTKPNQYVDKKPIVCGSAALTAFSPKRFDEEVKGYRSDISTSLADEDVVISFGQPRSLDKDIYTFITNSARENIFLLTNRDEMVCTMSVILSAIRSARRQGTEVQVWGHRTNQIYRNYKQTHFSKLSVADGKDAVCEAMMQLAKKIHDRAKGNELIVLLGMEKICEEIADDSGKSPFDAMMWSKPSSKTILSQGSQKPTMVNMTTTSSAESSGTKLELSQSSLDAFDALMALAERTDTSSATAGKTKKEADAELEKKAAAVFKETLGEDAELAFLDDEDDGISGDLFQMIQSSEPTSAKVDYLQLFKDLLEHGCKNGYHFLLCIDDYNKLRDMGLNIKSFNHRLSFQTDTNDTSTWIFNSSQAATLSPNVCLYSGLGAANGRFLITPYLHKGVTWGDWTIDEKGQAQNLANI